jgi:antitoxin component YwqK of YwqJK toxin-antitoxin module
MKKVIPLLLLFVFFQASSQRIYRTNYFYNGQLESKGWMHQNKKVDYWFYYFENGNKKEEGHYDANKKCKWWIFYEANKEINKKSEYHHDQLNGFSIFYKKNKIVRAEKYDMGKKMKEWNSISEFKKDNTLYF